MRVLLLLCLTSLAAFAKPSAQEVAFFEKEIRPLLAEHCYQCHSAEAKNLKGGLLLDSAAGWQAGGDTGEAIIPGDPDKSPLIHAIRYADRDLQMPPKYRLDDDAIASLEKWVAMGAPDPREGGAKPTLVEIDIESGREYWAFQSPDASPDKDIDHFIDVKLKEAGINAAELADRSTLIRRASFDLVGLPPSPTQIDAFLKDDRSDKDAFAALIDELLASDGFGERWGRHWLDVVRYGESMGRTRNYPFPYAWRYRDYVIDAFNADKPYDDFIREQLAGDLLTASSQSERDTLRVATGFLAMGSMDLNENQREQFRMDVVDEQIDVTGRALLGLTTGCARCHDHKFDPIPQSDYYALAGIFRSTETFTGYVNRGGGNRRGFRDDLLFKLDSVPAEVVAQEERAFDPKVQKRLKNQERQLAKLNKELRTAINLAKAKPKKKRGLKGKRKATKIALTKKEENATPDINALKKRQRALQQAITKTRRELNQVGNNRKKNKAPKFPRTANYAMGVKDHEKVEDCKINIRGEARNLGEEVPRGFLQVLCADGEHELPVTSDQSGRLALAEWIVSSDNPLTARVMANRLWHHLFGHGLVRTVDNFGDMGERPSHPDLLDHLAHRFMAEDWSIKTMIREIMLSETYRRQSTQESEAKKIDPENRLLAHTHVRRLQAEPLRDAILAISGQLNPERPDGSPVLRNSMGEMRRALQKVDKSWQTRRSVYLPIIRGFLPDFLQVFDFAEPSQVMGRRDVTTVSTQALFFMNNPFLMEQARHAATALLANEKNPRKRIQQVYSVTLGRTPSDLEIASSRRFLESASESKPREQWAGLYQALFSSAEFRYLR